MNPLSSDVLIIGAGPSGSIAAALLRRQGHSVTVIERQKFPRFSIGESLLAHALDFIAEAGMSEAVHSAGFQYKNGATFVRGDEVTDFNFAQQFTQGSPYTFQVQRAPFDQVLAEQAEAQGAVVRYEEEIVNAKFGAEKQVVTVRNKAGETYDITSRFVLDASGFGRTLPKMLNLEVPSAFPVRRAYFTHVEDRMLSNAFDRQKIVITVHPTLHDIWFWLIPFSNGRSSLGVVARDEHFARFATDPVSRLRGLVAETPSLARLLTDAVFDTPVNELRGYSANVKTMHGQGWALLGNAAEFLDPVFSSGVTIAMKSASMAAKVLHRQLGGEPVNWEADFAVPLKKGVDAFRTYVSSWYDGRFQTVIFHPKPDPKIKAMLCSVLAGYAWDEQNPFVSQSERRLQSLYEYCAALATPRSHAALPT
ncbi:MAG: tryptophan 7-halogenase [Myxococcaceae bacterium]|nr:tryptophan 7-halogenase [Myxococcaceae bacterium]